MIPRKLLVILGLVFLTLSCSPAKPIIVTIDTSTPTPTFISPTTSAISASGSIPITSGPYFTLTRDANCYDGPGVDYNLVLILQAGESVAVIGRNQENTWWRVFKSASKICWVADEWGTLTGEAVLIPITSSQYATEAVTPISPTQTKKKQIGEGTPVLLSTQAPQPTNPRPTATQPPPTHPPPTNPPPTNPPPTDPPPPTAPPSISTIISTLLP